MGDYWNDKNVRMLDHTLSSSNCVNLHNHDRDDGQMLNNTAAVVSTSRGSNTADLGTGRSRANTWPVNQTERCDEEEHDPCTLPTLPEESNSPSSSAENLSGPIASQSGSGPLGSAKNKKNSARRNPWGNMSYADLIEKAIDNAAEKRLTLSQIYDWLVQNVPYFKEKADTNSSAGWKMKFAPSNVFLGKNYVEHASQPYRDNVLFVGVSSPHNTRLKALNGNKNSVRHNLSLHNRFMRVQNETGTGKSSWWMVNQCAKFDKPSRRRTTSMETKEYEKRKGKTKKSTIREMPTNSFDGNGSASPPVDSTNSYQHLSVSDYRSRTSSTASTTSFTCLSPSSPCVDERSGSPALSPHSWSTSGYDSNGSAGGQLGFNYETDFANQLAKNVTLTEQQKKILMGRNMTAPAVGNYHPMTTTGFLPPTYADAPSRPSAVPYHGATKFATIPEEPRMGSAHSAPFFYARNGHFQQGSTMVTTAGGVSGGAYTTFTNPSYANWALPHDLESFTEPVQTFDFDWEELLRHEVAIERTIRPLPPHS